MSGEQELDLLGTVGSIRVLANSERIPLDRRTFVINPTSRGVDVAAPGANVVPPFSSRTLQSVDVVGAELLVLIQTNTDESIDQLPNNPGWCHHTELTSGAKPADEFRIPLWRSPQVEIGVVELRQSDLPGQDGGGEPRVYQIRLSVWYASSGTDCGIHNEHDFMEIHTQIAGFGNMQKFLRNDEGSLFEDEPMTPGYTTNVPYCHIAGNGRFDYPWHRYLADSDCAWLALEYVPLLT